MKLSLDFLREFIGSEVEFDALVDSVRHQGTKLTFVVMRYGADSVQCVYQGDFKPTVMSSLRITGKVAEDQRSPEGIEVRILAYQPLSIAQPQLIVNSESTPHQLDIYRHLAMRNRKDIHTMLARTRLLELLRCGFAVQSCTEVTPPSFVTTPCEGGATLFEVKYAPDMKVYLSQSAQFYLEAMVPVVGDCFSIAPSFRAEKSHTRRHLTEFTHVEAEYGFTTLDGLIGKIESLVNYVMTKMYEEGPRYRQGKVEVNPFTRPFPTPYMRLDYAQYIDALTSAGFRQSDGEPFTVDMDVPEATERAFIDQLGVPVFLTNFPAHLKSFYMKYTSEEDIAKSPTLQRIRQPTDSTDLLFPHCGEIVGASCRLTDLDILIERCKTEGISLKDFEMYLDLRRYGSTMSAGFGLGLERFLMCLLKLDSVKQAVPFPRRIDLVVP